MTRERIQQKRLHCGNAIADDFKIVECCDTCAYGRGDPMGCYVCVQDGVKCPDRDDDTDAWHQWHDDHYTRPCGWCGNYKSQLEVVAAEEAQYQENLETEDRYDYETETCEYLDQDSWCKLPDDKKCTSCLELEDGSKACEVMI